MRLLLHRRNRTKPATVIISVDSTDTSRKNQILSRTLSVSVVRQRLQENHTSQA